MNFPLKVTDEAINKAYELLVREGREDLFLRISVNAGGCSGLMTNISFTNLVSDNDLIEDFGEIEVVVDPMSVPFLQGATVEYHDTLERSGFSVNNPNAEGSCACGDSFH